MANDVAKPCSSPEAHQFDFWLGDWELTWPAEQTGGVAGEIAKGSNHIKKIMTDCALQEHFDFAGGSFQGKSWSVYNSRLKKWQQTWIDSSGAYLLFEGVFADGKMELCTQAQERDGKVIINRMVFRDISESSLFWDWQHSQDGGLSWQDKWNIHYQRKAKSQ